MATLMRRPLWIVLLTLPFCFPSHLYGYKVWTTCDVTPSGPTCIGKPLHWSKRNIEFWINPVGSGLSPEQTRTAIESAFQSWQNTGVPLTFIPRGFTDRQDGNDGMNVVFWSADPKIMPKGNYGSTIPSNVDLTTGEIQDMDIVLSTRRESILFTESPQCGGETFFNPFGIPYVWNLTEQRHVFNLFNLDYYLVQVQATATHEIGHLLGLAHSEVFDASMSTVFTTPTIHCTTTQAVLKEDDIAGIQFLYPTFSSTITVPANPLWTDTGLVLASGDQVTITASGSWSWGTMNGSPVFVGPEGGGSSFDVFQRFDDNAFGRLIGFVGSDPWQGHFVFNPFESCFFPQTSGYISVGRGTTFTAPPTGGKLWLGFNDDACSRFVDDNQGSVTAVISVTH